MRDVVIIGGGVAGLSAGLTLGRFRREVLICDSGKPRNEKSHGVHNFLSRDGILPKDLLGIARSQLEPYTTVELRAQEVIDITPRGQYFDVQFTDGTVEEARKILFATGVKDHLPPVAGIEDLFGSSAFHCPYCDGWEARDKQIAVLANGEGAAHLTKLLYALSKDIVICTNGASTLTEEDAHRFAKLGIYIISTPITQVNTGEAGLEGLTFADGRTLTRDVIFLSLGQTQGSTLPAKLGYTFTESGYVSVDEQGKTTVEGIFAAGDLTTPKQAVVFAAAKAFAAAAAINYELAQELVLRETSF